jgi:RimJ/RimL family protein N-acetyltransferase
VEKPRTEALTLKTARLVLRPLVLADAPRVQELAGAREVALNTLLIPHPYPDGAAETWISKPSPELRFAIDDGELVGVIGLRVSHDDDRAEIGYWIGVPYWGRGYASEAAAAVVRYGFEELGLNKIYAGYFSRNPASGAVLRKIGMRYEGTLRQHHKKWGEYVDVEFYAILRADFTNRTAVPGSVFPATS